MTRTLVLGYGNPSRRDDGVGLAVVNGLRSRMGLPPIDESTEWQDSADGPVSTLFLHQLTLDVLDLLAAYDRLVLVDAHIGVYPELVHRETVAPRSSMGMVSHVIKPEHLLLFAERVHGKAPETVLYSVRGFDFNFGEELSPKTAEGVQQVTDEIWEELSSHLNFGT